MNIGARVGPGPFPKWIAFALFATVAAGIAAGQNANASASLTAPQRLGGVTDVDVLRCGLASALV